MVHSDDNTTYQGPRDYTKTIELTQAQYDAMKNFGDNPSSAGFSTEYNGLTNSCIDFTWKALEKGGLNPAGSQGDVWPTWNADDVNGLLGASNGLVNGFIDFAFGLGDAINGIGPAINNFFNGARTYVPPRRDPLALDLDRDGIETIGANGTVLFDHDGDGIKTGTGWVSADDGLLVLDRNGNGQIDTGAELFGVDTVLANGQKASDGFAALRDLDANGDGVFDAQDARFADVRVWRDLNQNGTSQAGELFTLQTLGITAINLNATAETVNLGNGNVQTATASYVLADGTTGATAGVGLGETAANLELAVNPFYRQFTDAVPLTEQASLLPQMQGSGRVRDLREAVSLSPELAATISAYAQQTTRAGQLDLIGDALNTWGATSGMATSVEQASALGYRLIYLNQGQFMTEYESLLPYWDADESGLASLTAEQRQTLAQIKAQQAEIIQRIGTLERFNGMSFVTVDANGVTTGQGWRLDAENTPGVDGVRRVYVSLQDGAVALLNASYQSLKESVYSGLALQTRLKPYLDAVDLQFDTSGLHLDFAGMTAALGSLKQTDAANALIDMVELHKMAGTSLYSLGWNELPTLRAWIEEAANDAALQSVLIELGVKQNPDDLSGTEGADLILGQAGDEYLLGNGGNDLLSGGAGVDYLQGGTGNDVLDGGAGNDFLYGDDGNDVYLFGKGDGQDYLLDVGPTSNVDMIRFKSDVLPSDVEIFRELPDTSSLVLRIISTGDRITVQGWFGGVDHSYRIEQVEFADGTIWNEDTLIQAPIVGTPDNDYLVGGADNDVYLFGRGSGQDTIYDNDPANGGGQDTIRLKDDINPADLTLSRDASSLYLSINGSSDSLIISNWFGGTNYRVERMVFADGTVWDATLLANAPYLGTDGADYLYGTNDNETFIGGTGDDTLLGNGGNDVLDGGLGYDVLQGGAGDDIYVFGRGYGRDTMYDFDYANGGGQDTIRLAADINPADVTLSRDASSLYLSINGTSDRLTVSNWFGGTNYRIEKVEFADGTVWDATLLSNASYQTSVAVALYGNDSSDTLIGLGGDDALYGGGGDDTLSGGNDILNSGTGDDSLDGGTGNDTYVFGRGYGRDTISDYDTTAGNGDTILLKPDVAPGDITLWRDTSNLYLSINSTSDMITVQSWFDDPAYRVERIEFADGTVWDTAVMQAAILRGTNATDSLTGSIGNDIIEGLGGDDALTGDAGNDTLDGGMGDDFLDGGMGNDTYVFGRGYGQDTVSEYDTTAGNSDTILLNSDVAPGDVTLWRDASNLYVSINGTSDTITVQSWFDDPANRVERIEFADGTVWNAATLEAAKFVGTDAADYLYGTAGAEVMVGLGGNDYLAGDAGSDTLDGGTGNDTLDGGTGNDTYVFGRGYGQDTISDYDTTAGNSDTIFLKPDAVPGDITLWRDSSNLYLGINGTSDTITVQSWFDDPAYRVEQIEFADGTVWNAFIMQAAMFRGTDAADSITGTVGNDVIEGLGGDDALYGDIGNNFLDGGAGTDNLEGSSGNELFIGGSGNDTITTNTGADIIAFNRGDGADTVNASTGADSTLSLGGGIRQADLSFRKDASNLVLDTGNGESIVFMDWYGADSSPNPSLLTLQMIEEAAADFNPTGGDELRDNKVETFNFQGLADRFDQEVAANPGLTSWALTQALTDFHLTGSDTEALGGDLAYQYGKNGNLSNVGLTAAQSILSDPTFGSGAQTLKPLAGLQEGAVRLG